MSNTRLFGTWLGALALAVASVAIAIATGPSNMTLGQLLSAVADPSAAAHDAARAILIDVRLLRVAASFAVGSSLSLAGVLLQASTRNPIADPYLVGTSAGATLAAVGLGTLAAAFATSLPSFIITSLDWLQPLAAFVGAMVAVALAFWLARVGGPASPVRVLLAGLVLTAFAGAATSLLLYQASDLQLRAATGWLMGGVVVANGWQLVPAMVVIVISSVWAMLRAVQFNALGLGEEAARGVGVNDGAMLKGAVWLSSALAAVAVALAGIVGFVGLLVPHGLRVLVGRDHRALVPCSVLVGGAFLALADALARVIIAPAELPVGILTALAGCPLLLGLLRQRHRGRVQAPRATQTQAAVTTLTPQSCGSVQDTLLACEAMTVRYPGGDVCALRDTTVHFRGGQLVALVGPNGSGKSTMLRALAGALPHDGNIYDCGKPRPEGVLVDARHLAWLPQRLSHEAGATVRELVTLGRTPHLEKTPAGRLFGQPSTEDIVAIKDAIARVDLTAQCDAELETLSGGQLQRAFLAMTFAQQARVMLLDEPTTALDLPGAADLLQQLRQWAAQRDGLAVVAIHDLPLALARADLVVVVAQGQVLAVTETGSEQLEGALREAFGETISEFLPHR